LFAKQKYKVSIIKVIELSKWVGTREPIRFTTILSRVGLNFFYKFQYRLIFDPAHLEPDSPELN